jgi:hypothetical protein
MEEFCVLSTNDSAFDNVHCRTFETLHYEILFLKLTFRF